MVTAAFSWIYFRSTEPEVWKSVQKSKVANEDSQDAYQPVI